jgi:hypothetical protein
MWCFWTDASYSGTARGSSYTKYSAAGYWFNDTASSASANGGSCAETNFYKDDGWQGDYFTLYSQTLRGQNYKDPWLGNGVGYNGVGVNWNDKVTSIMFTHCS